eukprot:TRINITY_DN11760_c0_g2_i1.p1 TRINITY_DN11760_c0_g2~~TRINITY_DN11760_c0_g2_i1.p1  ORF type:complete len:712 (+),score=109.53 TRINITY_DN11760_c0_g2_i1:128-2137(+)
MASDASGDGDGAIDTGLGSRDSSAEELPVIVQQPSDDQPLCQVREDEHLGDNDRGGSEKAEQIKPAQQDTRRAVAEKGGTRRRLVTFIVCFFVFAFFASLLVAMLVAEPYGEEVSADGKVQSTSAVQEASADGKVQGTAAVETPWTAGGDWDTWDTPEVVAARSLSASDCHTAIEGEACEAAVTWAMTEGIHSNPQWYPGLAATSSFEDFQMLLFSKSLKGCQRPCSKPAPEGGEQDEENARHHHHVTDPWIARRRRYGQMKSCRRRHSTDGDSDLPAGWRCQGSSVGPVLPTQAPTSPPPTPAPPTVSPTPPTSAPTAAPTSAPTTAPTPPPYRNYYNGSNPLSIQAAPRRSDNYFLIIGDWGKFNGPGPCQLAIAAKMKEYVARQSALGKKLLLVGTVGDNFYWTGARPEFWHPTWGNVYGTNDPESPLYKVPWLATLGNHDYGDNDPYAFCPHVSPKAEIDGQPYASQQFNADRNPTRPSGTDLYWFPDYNFHYEVPEADLEIILVDKNYHNVVNNLGPHSPGFVESFRKCGGKEVVSSFMKRVGAAGDRLLEERGREGTAKTTVILQHYPEEKEASDGAFRDAMPQGRQTKVLQAFGHWHDQFCHHWNEDGTCDMILSGGGGGCCGGHRAGFTAVHLLDDGGFTTDFKSDNVSIPAWECHWRRRM